MTYYPVGGASNQEEIIFSSNNYYIKVRTYPKIEVGEVELLKKGEVSKVGIIFWIFLIIISIGEILHKYIPLQIGNLISELSYIFRVLTTIVLIVAFASIFKDYGIKGFNNLRINHGAEHKVIRAYKDGKIEDAQKFERFSISCGSYLWVPIIAIIILGKWTFYSFTICLLYYAGYMYVKQIRYVLFKTIGIPIQYIVTKEPVPEILDAAKQGLSKLIYEEEIRDVAKWTEELKKDQGIKLKK
jgi:uncharacterized protein YqhQ